MAETKTTPNPNLINIETFTNPQSRWRSRVLWMAIISLVVFILKTYLKVQIPYVDTLVNMLLNVLIAVGVINNPENGSTI